MENQEIIKFISLRDLWDVFVSKFIIMLIAAVVVVSGVFFYNYQTFKPLYKSTATLYILKQENENNKSNYYEFSLALSVVNDCTYLLKSGAVLDEVIGQLKLNMTPAELSRGMTITNPANTRILEISVKTEDSALSKEIVDCICKVGAEKIKKVMGFNQVNPFKYGTVSTAPCNKVSLITYFIIGAVTAFVVYLIFLIISLFDDKVSTEKDVEKYLGLSVLSIIPDAYSESEKKYYTKHEKKYYRYLGTYNSYSAYENQALEVPQDDEQIEDEQIDDVQIDDVQIEDEQIDDVQVETQQEGEKDDE